MADEHEIVPSDVVAKSAGPGFGSIAGVIFAASQRFVSPESFTLQESVLIVLMIVIGGIGNILGIVAGAAILILLPEVLREFAEWRIPGTELFTPNAALHRHIQTAVALFGDPSQHVRSS